MVQDFFHQQYWKLFPYESLLVASSFSGLFGLPNSILQWTYNEHKVETCWKQKMRYTLQNGTCILKLITLGKKATPFKHTIFNIYIIYLFIQFQAGVACKFLRQDWTFGGKQQANQGQRLHHFEGASRLSHQRLHFLPTTILQSSRKDSNTYPSGKLTWLAGKSRCSGGNTSSNGPCSAAMLDYRGLVFVCSTWPGRIGVS